MVVGSISMLASLVPLSKVVVCHCFVLVSTEEALKEGAAVRL